METGGPGAAFSSDVNRTLASTEVTGEMEIDDLRDKIWDYLFKVKSPQSIADLATLAASEETIIRLAVNHEWFAVADDRVSIAYWS